MGSLQREYLKAPASVTRPGCSGPSSPNRGAAPRGGSGLPSLHEPDAGAGDPCRGFMREPGRCWRMVYSHQLQAIHCHEAPSWARTVVQPSGRPLVAGLELWEAP